MSIIRILYNHRCALCRAEISHYQARATAANAPIVFEDLHQTDLGVRNLTPDQAKRRIHVAFPDGRIESGIAAFIAIWRSLPGLAWIAWIVERPGIHALADFGYNNVIAPWIYRRQVRRDAHNTAG